MAVLYSIITHSQGERLIYQGLCDKTTHVAKFLQSVGMKIRQPNVMELLRGTLWSNKVIVIKHEVDDSILLTHDLLKDLKLEGTKQAEAILKQRRQKRK